MRVTFTSGRTGIEYCTDVSWFTSKHRMARKVDAGDETTPGDIITVHYLMCVLNSKDHPTLHKELGAEDDYKSGLKRLNFLLACPNCGRGTVCHTKIKITPTFDATLTIEIPMSCFENELGKPYTVGEMTTMLYCPICKAGKLSLRGMPSGQPFDPIDMFVGTSDPVTISFDNTRKG